MRKVGGDLHIQATKCGLESLSHEAHRLSLEVGDGRENLKGAHREYDQLKQAATGRKYSGVPRSHGFEKIYVESTEVITKHV